MSSLECTHVLDKVLTLNIISHVSSTLSDSDSSGFDGHNMVQLVGIVLFSIVSVALVLVGYICIRPMSGLILGGVAFFVALETTEWAACEAKMIVALIAGICVLLFTLCLLRTGLFLIGATTFGMTGYILVRGIVPKGFL
jgi:hypothetical protein